MDYEESKESIGNEQIDDEDEDGWGGYDDELDMVPSLSKGLSKEPDIIITNPEKLN